MPKSNRKKLSKRLCVGISHLRLTREDEFSLLEVRNRYLNTLTLIELNHRDMTVALCSVTCSLPLSKHLTFTINAV